MGNQRRSRKKLTLEEEDEVFNTIVNNTSNTLLNKIKVDLKAKTVNQKQFINKIKTKEVIICSGPAGSGKTYISCAMALDLLKNDPRYRKIVIVKSVTPLKDEELGYLKGTLEEKMSPYIYSFLHNFEKIIGKGDTESLKNAGYIETLPIAFMRGINIDNSIIIVDETQNISIENIRTILTRLGENSKMIFIGDVRQIDMRNKKNSSLGFLIDKFKDIEEIGITTFEDDDVVRNPLIKKIEKVFNDNL
jgi:phosphate starvation-inducible protein PhoH and related proteins